MSEQVGWRGLLRRIQDEAPTWTVVLPQLPRLFHQALKAQVAPRTDPTALLALKARRQTNRLLGIIAVLLAAIAAGIVTAVLYNFP
jgi:ubiquinone biosynthesis protein